MAYIESTYPIVLTSGGGTINLPVTDPYGDYNITGSATLAASYVIQASGTPVENTKFVFNYEASLVLNGNTLTIFGLSLDASQALQSCFIISKYDGSAWDTQIQPDFENDDVIETRHIIDDAVDKDKIAADVAGSGLGQNVDGSLEVKVDSSTIEIATDTLRIKDDGVTNAKLAEMTSYTLKGNNTGSTANPQDIAISTLLNSNAWKINGNSGTTAGTNFIGTTDNVDLVFKANSIECGRIELTNSNTSFGRNALDSLDGTGVYNVAIGRNALTATTSGDHNTAIGSNSALANTTGIGNSLLGSATASDLDGGDYNTIIGYASSQLITTGGYNTHLGFSTGQTLTTGSNNTVIGATADVSSATATNRIALGYGAEATSNYQFAIPDDVTTIKFKGIVYTLPTTNGAGVLTNDGSGNLTWA